MKKIIFVFCISFAIIAIILNSQFLLAYLTFTKDTLTPPAYAAQRALLLPLTQNNTPQPLPEQATLTIPRIGITVPILFSKDKEINTEALYTKLQNGVINYPTSVKPGEKGTSIILGHSSSYPWQKGRYRSVFALLGKLQTGDTFTVRYDDGRLFTYTIQKSVIFNPKIENHDLTQLTEHADDETIVLVSCWPIGTDYQRIAVIATRK